MLVLLAAIGLSLLVMFASDCSSKRDMLERRIAVLESKLREQENEKKLRAIARKEFGAGVN